MSSSAQLLRQARKLHENGRLRDAEALYRRILATDPTEPDALHLLGVIAAEAGDLKTAAELISEAIANRGTDASYFLSLGNCFAGLGRFAEAQAAYEMSVTLAPDYAPAHNNLGMMRQAQGDVDGALAAFAAALERNPKHVDAHNNIGTILLLRGHLDPAVGHFLAAREQQPNDPVILNSLGAALTERGDIASALEVLTQAAQLAPKVSEIQVGLGNAWETAGDLDRAAAAHRAALALDDQNHAARGNLGAVLARMGQIEDARAAFARHHADTGLNGSRIRQSFLFPAVLDTPEAISDARMQYESDIDALAASGIDVGNPLVHVDATANGLSSHGYDNRALLEKTAAMFLKICPALAFVAPHCRPGAPTKVRPRIKIGIVSSFLYDHTVGRLHRRLITNLPRDRFEVVLFPSRGRRDGIFEELAKSADDLAALPRDLGVAHDRIALEELDVLFFLDIGPDPFSYFLAFACLAPIQIAGWGHAETSGLSSIDYFLSYAPLEPEGSDSQYTERLVRLSAPPIGPVRPRRPPKFRPMMFGLPEGKHIFVAPQDLPRLHVDFDGLVGAILTEDPDAVLVLLEGQVADWTRAIKARFARTLPAFADRIFILPRMMAIETSGLIGMAHALLDPPHNSDIDFALEAMAIGTPVVTCPGTLLRSKLAAGLYHAMGLRDLIARDLADYVGKALALGRDLAFRTAWSAQIDISADVLFESDKPASALAEFLETAYRGRAPASA